MSGIHRRPLISNALSPLEMFLLSADVNVIDKVLGFLNPAEIFRLHRVSHDMHAAMESYVRRTWCPEEKVFRGWFPPELWYDVRDVLDECGAVVSGSAALQFMRRGPPIPGSDLDVFVPWWGLLELGRFLRRAGYKFRPRAGSPFVLFDQAALTLPSRLAHRRHRKGQGSVFSFAGSFEVFDFYVSRGTSWAGPMGKHVQLIAVYGNALEHVLSFHSTAVMNIVTGKYAASVFPRATFVDQVSYVTRTYSDCYGGGSDWKAKYTARGFEVKDECAEELDPTNGEMQLRRFLGDKHTWVVRFDDFRPVEKRVRDEDDDEERGVVPNIPFEVILPSRGPVVVNSYMNIMRPFTVSAVAFASRTGSNLPYGGTYETAVAFGV